jgi:hypothetical protein
MSLFARLPWIVSCAMALWIDAGVCALAAPEPSTPPTRPAEPNREGAADRGAANAAKLRLLPQVGKADAPVPKALIASRWVEARPKDILGRGTDTVLQFRQGEDQKLTVDRATRTFRSVNDRAGGGLGRNFDEKKESFPATLDGPLLRYGDEQQTFVVTDKVLVVNALVPLGEGKWYYTARQSWGNGGHRDEEMLLEFADDPTKKDEGAGTIQLTSSNGPAVLKEEVRFKLQRAGKDGRLVLVESADPQIRARRAEILFPAGDAYGLVLDRPNLNSRVFTAEAVGK